MSPPPPLSNHDAALAIVRALRAAGHTAYFAGGCVRDRLLGLDPKDFDVATSAPPAAVQSLFPNTQPVGAAFGVILVRLPRTTGPGIEVATFRTDGSYSDGRRPDSVRFATPEEDARRRDFTINGLFYDPLEDRVLDFVAGRADLDARTLRAIGDPDARFAEDHLRLVRAVRFAARFSLTVDPATATAVRRHAHQLRTVAPERVGDELRRALTPPTRTAAWSLLRSLGLAAQVFRFVECADRPTLSLTPHLPQNVPVSFALSLAAGTLEETYDGPPPPSPAADAALLELLTDKRIAATVAGLRQSLRLSNDEADALTAHLTSLVPLLGPTPPTLARKRRFLALPTAPGSLHLLHALHTAHLFPAHLPTLLPDLEALSNHDNAPPPLLTGDHLTAAGLTPGPAFRKLLEAAYDAQLESKVTTQPEALALALSLLPKP